MPAITTQVDTGRLDRLIAAYRKLAHPDATPLMVTWMNILEQDNRNGVLAGTDKNGNAMTAVKYRPKGEPHKLSAEQKKKTKSAARRSQYGGFVTSGPGDNNNLSSAEYRKLAGPPLAPRGILSRVITHYKTDYAELRKNYWTVTFWWEDVVSKLGVPFLKYHFKGDGKLPKRDLRGVRPESRRKARKSARAWMIDQIRSNGE